MLDLFNLDKDIAFGIRAAGYVIFAGFLISPTLAAIGFVGISIYFIVNGLSALFSENNPPTQTRNDNHISSTISASITDESTIAEKIKSIHIANDFKCPACGATVEPTSMKCGHCGSILVASVNLPRPATWADVEIGQSVRVLHPKSGELTLPVIRRVYYGELWQAQMKPNVPWTLTGGYFVGLMLDKDIFLVNWQSRFFLLDKHQPLTDMDINRDFAPYARKFASSNQTANVSFEYQGVDWHMDDIGRFRIEYTEGEGTQADSGAVGRFIHASNKKQALVIEDYQSGGVGLDTLWQGWQIDKKNIKL
jgi:hypothetical protein